MTASSCRSCGHLVVEPFYEVRGVPTHSCLVLRDQDVARSWPTGDVTLAWCQRCGFIQNDAFDPDRVEYGADYEDSQAYSPHWVSWARELVSDLTARRGLQGGRALEIGCGKGDFLALLADVADMDGVGYDPAFRPGPLVPAVADRLTFHRREFTAEVGVHEADLVCCRHVLEHVDDPAGFLAMVRAAIGDALDTVVLFEVPGSERILEEFAFWDIYYEHCAYFTETSLSSALERAGFEVLALRSEYDGQYLLLEARPRPAVCPPSGVTDAAAVGRLAAQIATFAAGMPARLSGLREQLAEMAARGEPTVFWGAGSKAVGCLTTVGLTDEVVAVVDIDPAKQGGFLAGTGHPVVAPAELTRLRPGHVVVMNSSYTVEVATLVRSLGLHAEVEAMR
jgi:SAM-dependent methyltransferase